MQTYLGPNKFPQDINDFGKLKLRREDFRLVFVTLLIWVDMSKQEEG